MGRLFHVLSLLLVISQVLGFIVPATMTFKERFQYFESFAGGLKGVNISWTPTTGFGFRLIKNATQGECLVHLSLRSAVTSADFYTLSSYTEQFEELEKLAIRVLYEKFSKKRDHYAKQYVDSLPVEPFHMVHYWNPEDFTLYDKYGLVLLDYNSMFKYNSTALHAKVLKTLKDVPGLPKEMLEKDALDWAMGITLSRSYNLVDEKLKQAVNHPNLSSPILAMFPILDIINHYPVPITQRATQPTIFSITPGLISDLCSLAPFSQKEGHEYYGTYGDKSNYDLITMYGFALETNPDDLVDVGVPQTQFCTGTIQVNRCFYVTPAYKISVPAIRDILAALAHYQFNTDVTFDQIIAHISTLLIRSEDRKHSLSALTVYRNVVLQSIMNAPMRELRRLKQECSTYRCELIYTVLVSQRVARYVHTEQIDRKILMLLASDLDILPI